MTIGATAALAAWAALAAAAPRNEEASPAELRLRLDPRLELHAALLELSSGKAGDDCPGLAGYRQRLLSRLAGQREHAAVRLYRSWSRDEARRPERLAVLAGLTDPPELAERSPALAAHAAALGGWGATARWLAALRAFARDSAFAKALEEEGRDASARAERLRGKLAAAASFENVERYTGLPWRGAVSILGSALGDGVDAPVSIERSPEGAATIRWVATLCYENEDDSQARTQAVRFWHEATHAALDPLADGADPGLPPQARELLREYAAQAVSLRLAGARPEILSTRPELDARLVEKMTALLRDEYEPARARHKTIASFYPRLAAAFLAGRPADPASAPAPLTGPDGVTLRRARAIERFRAGDLDGALAENARALAIDGDDIDALRDRGALLHQLRRWDDEQKVYLRMLQASGRGEGPSFDYAAADALLGLSSLRLARGQRLQARLDCLKALAAGGEQWPRRAEARAQLHSLP